MASSWIKNKNTTNFPKINNFCKIYEFQNYNARGLIVKYVYIYFVLISNILFINGSPLSDKPGHI
jgi:hypothetical protein